MPEPHALPLVRPENLEYLGAFAVPKAGNTDPTTLAYGGWGLGMGADGKSLYFGGHDHYQPLARVSIPAIGGTAQILTPPTEVVGSVGRGRECLGGTLPWNGKVLINRYVHYDAAWTAQATTIVADQDLKNFKPPVRIGEHGMEGHIAGPMTVIPQEWRPLLGGPALTGLAGISIISRTSAGPSAWVFNPDDVVAGRHTPATPLVDYPLGTPLADDDGPANDYYIQSDVFWGLAFPPGTRSLLVIGRHGMGGYCYGGGVSAMPASGRDAEGNEVCLDPMDRNKGTHAFPYRHQIWAYDANELVKVKNGQLKPWEIRPYAVWALKGVSDTGYATMTGACFDPVTRRLYVTDKYGDAPKVHVWQVKVGTTPGPDPIPVPVNGVGAWGPYITDPATAGPCVGTPPTQRVTQRSVFRVTTPAAHGGTPCEAVDGEVRTREITQPCIPVPVPIPNPGRIVKITRQKGGTFELAVTLDSGGTYKIITGSLLDPPLKVGDYLDMTIRRTG